MKRIFLVATVLALSIVSCNSLKSKTGSKTAANTQKTEMEKTPNPLQDGVLVGTIERGQLAEGDFKKWFDPRYDAYQVSAEDITALDKQLIGVEVSIFMGTWCPDSRREVPNFYKIIDATNADPKIDLVAVTRSKTTPSGLENGKNIERVPTFIFSKNGKEMGRIVEYPIESLEKDMLKILNGEEYKHAYDN